MSTLPSHAPPIAWAVALGCTTADRLAREWQISKRRAAKRLVVARRQGWLRGNGRGRYVVRVRGRAPQNASQRLLAAREKQRRFRWRSSCHLDIESGRDMRHGMQ